MRIFNDFLSLELSHGSLRVSHQISNESIKMEWPAVAIALAGQEIVPTADNAISPPTATVDTLTQSFTTDEISFEVSLRLEAGAWFRKSLTITSLASKPVPDYVIIDRQSVKDDTLEVHGYKASKNLKQATRSEEEGAGSMPGCGYPLIGKKYFAGLEHPAGFNIPANNGAAYVLKHHPVWHDRRIQGISEVFGWSVNARDNFAEYLNTVRLPVLSKPLISYCTFWSDPYIGNNEYQVSLENYENFIGAFFKFGLVPDVLTLDAGWNDRNSVFQSKKEVGQDAGLNKLRDYLEANGCKLSLWLSHNGPMGIAPDYLRGNGFEVGGGPAAAYSGDGYGVMLDRNFEAALTERFIELTGKIGAIHFKIDWDNECSTNEKFAAEYPTINHVREESINAMIRIAATMRKANPDVITRNGWWPSPWWLCHANHLWLCHSGDSEYAALPALNQRESASTHRDLMYYNVVCRDKSAIPLDCFDNHEFPDALRNPFMEDPVSWTNAVWLSFMRGSTYLAYMLQPESLEYWQADSFRQIMQFCRENAANIFVKDGHMVLGHPGKGEIYGFIQPGANETWCILRNPSPIPQKLVFDAASHVKHRVKSVMQFYPHYEYFDSECELTLPAHGIKILILSSQESAPEFSCPFMAKQINGNFEYSFPASLTVNDQIKPLITELNQIPEMKFFDVSREATGNNLMFSFGLKTHYRQRQCALQLAIHSHSKSPQVKACGSRYPGAAGSMYTLPITMIPVNAPGYGEQRNLDYDPENSGISYYTINIPDGGEFFYKLEISGLVPEDKVEIWATGWEAPSREKMVMAKGPANFKFKSSLPFQHPLGFERLLKLEE